MCASTAAARLLGTIDELTREHDQWLACSVTPEQSGGTMRTSRGWRDSPGRWPPCSARIPRSRNMGSSLPWRPISRTISPSSKPSTAASKRCSARPRQASPGRPDVASPPRRDAADAAEHILKEQDGVFPAALASLGIADWEAVEAVRAPGRLCALQRRRLSQAQPASRTPRNSAASALSAGQRAEDRAARRGAASPGVQGRGDPGDAPPPRAWRSAWPGSWNHVG